MLCEQPGQPAESITHGIQPRTSILVLGWWGGGLFLSCVFLGWKILISEYCAIPEYSMLPVVLSGGLLIRGKCVVPILYYITFYLADAFDPKRKKLTLKNAGLKKKKNKFTSLLGHYRTAHALDLFDPAAGLAGSNPDCWVDHLLG